MDLMGSCIEVQSCTGSCLAVYPKQHHDFIPQEVKWLPLCVGVEPAVDPDWGSDDWLLNLRYPEL